MPCPCLVTGAAVGWVGGWVGDRLFGIKPPQHEGGALLSYVLTANCVSITIIALERLFKITLCAAGGFTLPNVAQVVVKTFIMGVVYSIGINYLLNRYVFPPIKAAEILSEPLNEKETPCSSSIACCCQSNLGNIQN